MMNLGFTNGIAAQPGEYMLPNRTVSALGGPGNIDRIVARTDSNSKAAKLGSGNVDMLSLLTPPPMESRFKVIPLLPKEEPDTSVLGGLSGSEVPSFSAGFGFFSKAKDSGSG